jgi:uncharacterized protein YndB with AHSA1/START domain
MKTKEAVEPLIVERTINAPVARVWQALTTLEQIHRWFFELKEFKPEVGFAFAFTVVHEGYTYSHHCQVTEVIPQKKLSYTWRYEGHEGNSLVTYELVAEGNHTHLKLTHTGLETFPKAPPFARSNFLGGWTFISGALKEFMESPTADRDMVITRVLDAPRELVWEAMTNPKHVVNWWGPRGFTAKIEKMDFHVGGVWKQTLQGPDGTNYHNEYVFKEIVKPERIVLSHGGKREDGEGVSFVATWTFETVAPDKTKVTIHNVFPSAAERNRVVREFNAIEGGKQTLERLGEYLAKM